jgi:hypothetical protein
VKGGGETGSKEVNKNRRQMERAVKTKVERNK